MGFDSIQPKNIQAKKAVTSSLANLSYTKKRKYQGLVNKSVALSIVFLFSFGLIFTAIIFYNSGKAANVDTKETVEKTTKKEISKPPEAKTPTDVLGATSSQSSNGQYNNFFQRSDYYIEIPKLNIIGNVVETDTIAKVDSILDKGIAHIPGTANPGEIGNTIFTAHSSSYGWGYYSQIFATLNKLQNDDIIVITKNRLTYRYRVYAKEVIEPILERVGYTAGEENIVLITCWPIGSSEQRLVVYAQRLK